MTSSGENCLSLQGQRPHLLSLASLGLVTAEPAVCLPGIPVEVNMAVTNAHLLLPLLELPPGLDRCNR